MGRYAASMGPGGPVQTAASATSASTKPSMSWRSASTAGSSPRSRKAALVTGPMLTSRAFGGTVSALEEEPHRRR